MYKWGDDKPYLLRTKDYGETWQLITAGIDPAHFSRVIRADPKTPGLLFAGTESGIYMSTDDGASWQAFQRNLPIVPVTDLTIHGDVLVAATQGRSLWVMDDLHQLRQVCARRDRALALYSPAPASRMTGGAYTSLREGTNHPGGLTLFYQLPDELKEEDTLRLVILDAAGDTVTTYGNHHPEKQFQLNPKKGFNKFNWNLRYAPAKRFDGMILWAGTLTGPKAIPGAYTAVLALNDTLLHEPFTILRDERSTASEEDYSRYLDFGLSLRDKITEAHEAIIDIRAIRGQLAAFKDRKDVPEDIRDEIKAIDSLMTGVETDLYQTKNRSGQDPLNFPVRLTNKLAYLNMILGNGEYAPTDQAYAVRDELNGLIDAQLSAFADIRDNRLPDLNKRIRESGVDIIKGDPD
jgi:hypothetical protein